jgi:hypothetical protein
MSESSGEVQGDQVEKSNDLPENQTQSNGNDAILEKLERLERESKEWKGKYQAEVEAKKNAELSKLKEKGEMSEYAKKLETELNLQREQNKVMTEQVVFNNIKLQVAAKCPDAQNIDLVMATLSLDKDDIDVERMTALNLDEKIAHVRKVHDYLFKNGVAGVDKKIPQYQKPREKSIDDMSSDELETYIKNKWKN